MTDAVQFFYDFRSPYSYLAFTQLREMGVDIVYRPMQILTVMERVGNVPTTIICKAKGQYARADLARWGQRLGISLAPSDMKANDGDAMARAVCAATSAEQAGDMTAAIYRAIWSEARTLADSAAVLGLLSEAGLDVAGLATRIDAPETVAQLAANTDEAVERGVFGSPTVFVGETMFFGNDRMDFVREALAQQGAAA